MELPLAGQQSLPQETLRQLEATALDEISMAGDQDILDVVRMIEKIDVLGSELEVCDVAVRARKPCQETERVTAELKQASYQRLAFGSARLKSGRHNVTGYHIWESQWNPGELTTERLATNHTN